MATPILELKNFKYSYGNIEVVHGINLTVNEGECVTIIGANGAGKTTTLQAISGLLRARGISGEILFEGKPIQGLDGSRIAKLGLGHCLEGRHIFSKLTVEDNLIAAAYLRKDMNNVKTEIDKIYERFPVLGQRKTQLGGTLSGGEQQMLAIARCLISNPKIILMDEPSMGLAPLITKEVFNVIRELHAEGKTILFVEQNSKIALKTADRGYVFQLGKIVAEGNSEDLINDPEVQKAYLGE